MRTERVALLVLGALLLSSCQEAVEETAASPTPGENVQAYCDAVEKVAFLPGAPKEDIPEEIEKFNRGTKLPAFEEVAAVAPDDVQEDIEVQLNDLKRGGGRPRAEADAARQRTMAFDHGNCGWQTIDMTVTEYELEGIPAKLKPGTTSLKLANEGKEDHDLAFRRIDADVTESLAEIVQDEMKFFRDEKVDAIGGMGARPGRSGYALLDLTPGRYGMVCFALVGREEGAPHHWERGELKEFTVE